MVGRVAFVFCITGLAVEPVAVHQPSAGTIERGTLPVSWVTAASCPETPPFRVHEYNSSIPGHEPASIALYDRRTALLMTGDTLYPGRLYVRRMFRDFTVWPLQAQ